MNDHPILKAAAHGDTVRLRTFLDISFNPNVTDPTTGKTPLMHAAVNNHEPAVLLLLQYLRPDQVDAEDNYGMTALMHTAMHSEAPMPDREKMVHLLVEHKANINRLFALKESLSRTPIYHQVMFAALAATGTGLSGARRDKMAETTKRVGSDTLHPVNNTTNLSHKNTQLTTVLSKDQQTARENNSNSLS